MPPPGFLAALWLSFVGFVASLFKKSPSAGPLPVPVTARSLNTPCARPTFASVRVASIPRAAWVKHPSPLKRPTSTTPDPVSSTARTAPICRARSPTPSRPPTDLEHVFHPPPSPLHMSLSGIFATPPRLASDIALGPLSLASPPNAQTSTPSPPPGSPSLLRRSHDDSSPSCHTHHSRSPSTPSTPSSAVMVHLDRSAISPTTMSDGSLEVISLGDRRGFLGSPVNDVGIGPLPSPWSPIGKAAPPDVWMSVDGMLMNATGPVVDNQDDSVTSTIPILSVSRISTTSLYSSPSVLNALGISVFVNLDEVSDQDDHVDTSTVPKLSHVRDENRPTLVTQDLQTPRKRRDTLPSVASHTLSYSARTTKCFSTPLTKLDSVGISHVRSATSISSMAYELRMGLFSDGRSITAFENIISLLDQASPESESTWMTPHRDAMQPAVVG